MGVWEQTRAAPTPSLLNRGTISRFMGHRNLFFLLWVVASWSDVYAHKIRCPANIRGCYLVTAQCPKCLEYTQLSRHHWAPRRVFGNSDDIILLCRYCHDLIEGFLSKQEKRNRGFFTRSGYWELTATFLATPRKRRKRGMRSLQRKH